jgi:hypothetical protein
LPRRSFEESELARFLTEVDRALPSAGSVVVIGGAAAILQYGATRPTEDIDTYSAGPTGLEEAISAAWERTGLPIPVQYAAVADAPYNYEDRLETLRSPRLSRLEVKVPERHDLALMKIARGEERDIVVLEQLHARRPFDREILVSRFLDEMPYAMQDPRSLRLKFLVTTARLYGREAADETRNRLIRVPAERALAGTTLIVNGLVLNAQGIHDEVLSAARFQGTLRQMATGGGIAFPLRDDRGVVGLAVETTAGLELRGEHALGVWGSNGMSTDKRLIVVSHPVDALAIHQWKDQGDARYVATVGPLGSDKERVLRNLLSWVSPEKVVLAFAADADGKALAAAARTLAPAATMLHPPRFRSWRAYVGEIEQEWIRAQGLAVPGPTRGR